LAELKTTPFKLLTAQQLSQPVSKTLSDTGVNFSIILGTTRILGGKRLQ